MALTAINSEDRLVQQTFIELKAVYRNIRAGFDGNLTDYLHPNTIAQAFHHNAFLVVRNGDNARYGSITSK